MRRLRPALRRLARCEGGAAAVEFAIVCSILLMLLIGILELGRAFFVQNQISFLADGAVRRLMVQPETDAAQLEADLRQQFTAGNPDALSVTVATQTAGSTDYRILTIGFPLTLFIPNLTSEAISLSVSRRVPVS